MTVATSTPARASDERASGDKAFYGLLVVTAALVVGCIQYIFLRVPEEATMGIVQKIFYFHVPSAFGMYLGALACLAGSVGYLWKGSLRADAMARAGADVAVSMGIMLLISGSLWAAKGWGKYWSWDPRLTTSMLSVLIYVAYSILRGFTQAGEAERRFAAALGILGAANLPIIRYSVYKWGGQHPQVVTGQGGGLQHPAMKTAFAMASLTFILFAVLLIWHRTRIHLVESRLAALEQEALELGLSGD